MLKLLFGFSVVYGDVKVGEKEDVILRGGGILLYEVFLFCLKEEWGRGKCV